MKFLIRQNAYINLPMHLESDPPGVIRLLPQMIKAEPSRPTELELPDDIDLDSISSKWEPLDERAARAQERLKAKRLGRPAAAAAAGDKPEGKAKRVTAADALDALAALPLEQRKAILAKLAEKEAADAKAAADAETMSGQAAQAGKAAQPPKA